MTAMTYDHYSGLDCGCKLKSNCKTNVHDPHIEYTFSTKKVGFKKNNNNK